MVAWILDAATRVFEEQGYAAGTTNKIAERAGVSVGSLYQYFPNKDALLTALALEHLREGEALAREKLAAASAELPPLEKMLLDFAEAFVELHEANPGLHRLLFEEVPLPQEVWQAYRAFTETLVANIASLFAKHPEVNLPRPDIAAYLAVTSFEALAHQLVIHPPTSLDRQEVIRELSSLFKTYLMVS